MRGSLHGVGGCVGVYGVQDEAIALRTDRPTDAMGSPTGRSRARVKDELPPPTLSFGATLLMRIYPLAARGETYPLLPFYPPGCERRDLPLLPFYPPFENGENTRVVISG